ncbi:hypothetical protein [Glaciecola sp. 1036]|uniref:hypothetical protein n=1 Tax=Alteromonadaceae TaxID=72275 RepID=UPI003CFF5F67
MINYIVMSKKEASYCIYLPIIIYSVGALFFDAFELHFVFGYLILGAFAHISYQWYKNNKSKIINKEIQEDARFLYLIPSIAALFPIFLFWYSSVSINEIALQSDNNKNIHEEKEAISVYSERQIEPSINSTFENKERGLNIDEVEDITLFVPVPNSPKSSMTQLGTKLIGVLNRISGIEELSEDTKSKIGTDVARLQGLILKKDWDGFLSAADTFSADYPDSISNLANTAIMVEAPIEVILKLVTLGAKISAASILHLIKSGDFNTVITLENYGMKPDSEMFKNFNVIDAALMGPIQPKSFEFLVNRYQATYGYSEIGTDTIGNAIIFSRANRDFISYYISLLLKGSDKFSDHHRALMASLKQEDEAIYTELVSSFPELAHSYKVEKQIKENL